jgi:hypothetical protein
MIVTREKTVCVRTDIICETSAEALREAARYTARCDNAITDTVVCLSKDGEPMVSIYEEVPLTAANELAAQIVDDLGGYGSKSEAQAAIAHAIMHPLSKGE